MTTQSSLNSSVNTAPYNEGFSMLPASVETEAKRITHSRQFLPASGTWCAVNSLPAHVHLHDSIRRSIDLLDFLFTHKIP